MAGGRKQFQIRGREEERGKEEERGRDSEGYSWK